MFNPKASAHDARTRGRLSLVVLSVVGTCAAIYVTAALLAHDSLPRTAGPQVAAPVRLAAKPIPSFKKRDDLGALLERERFTRGVELGVQKGIFADITLGRWKSAKQYVLVDLWGHQKNYKDSANVDNRVHKSYKDDALRRTAKYAARGTDVQVCQGLTLECVHRFEDGYFDYIYVDARHDYKGVMEDIVAWWPKLRNGGIMAGHDYVSNDDGPRRTGQDWSINYDGTRDPEGRAVKGAVDDFAEKHGLQVVVSYRESAWNTWAVRKPPGA